jgi:selenide,water dikinase
VAVPEGFDERIHRVIFDAETSGGLLMAVAPEHAGVLAKELAARGVAYAEVGEVKPRSDVLIRVN